METAYVQWRIHEQDLIRGALVVLKLATNLKGLYLQNQGSYDSEWESIDKLTQHSHSLKLQFFSNVNTSRETLDLLRDQTELTQLAVLSDIKDLTDTDASEPLIFPKLQILWATPGWARVILPNSPVQSFGLVHVDFATAERSNWRTTVDSLIQRGGHPTVNCLAIPYEIFFWDHHSVALPEYGLAFPNATKLCITLSGYGTERTVS